MSPAASAPPPHPGCLRPPASPLQQTVFGNNGNFSRRVSARRRRTSQLLIDAITMTETIRGLVQTWASGFRYDTLRPIRYEKGRLWVAPELPLYMPPSEPRPKRPAAAAADAAMLAELEATTSRDAEVRTCTARSARSNPAGRCMPTRRRPRRRRWACVRQPSLSGRGSKLLLLLLLLCCCGAAGHGNFGTLLEALGGDSSQINAVRVFFIPYKPIRSSLNRIRGNPKNHV